MNLITDRTYSDVERWKFLRSKGWQNMTLIERQEWMGEISPTPSATKGMYTHRDLNRVESAVESITAKFRERGYDVSDIVVKTNWTYSDTFRDTDMVRYLGNISKLCSFFPVYSDTPSVPNINDKFNYKLANDIEKILIDVETIFSGLSDSQYYCGELFAGEI